MEIFLFWIGFAVIVGVAANTRGRSGFGWFLLAVGISPLLAGLLLIVLPRLDAAGGLRTDGGAFKAEGVLAGIPYRVTKGGIVEAMMQGGLVRFNNMDQFRAASEGRDAPPVDADSRDTDSRDMDFRDTDFREFPDVMGGIRHKVNADNTVTARTPTGVRTYSDWASFLQATKTRRW